MVLPVSQGTATAVKSATDIALSFYGSLKRQGGWRPLMGAPYDYKSSESFSSGPIKRRLLLGRSRKHVQIEVQVGTTVADVGDEVTYYAEAGAPKCNAKVSVGYRDETYDLLAWNGVAYQQVKCVPAARLHRRINHSRIPGGDVLMSVRVCGFLWLYVVISGCLWLYVLVVVSL